MIKLLIAGVYMDDAVPEGFVQTETWDDTQIDFFAHPKTACLLLREGRWAAIMDLFDSQPPGTFAIPQQYLAEPLSDEILDVVRALRTLEPDWLAEYCQYPPCILRSERVAGGYALCAHHGDALVDRAFQYAHGGEVLT